MGCENCDLHKNTPTPCLKGVSASKSEVFILSDKISYPEAELKEFLIDASGKYLKQLLLHVGIDVNKCYITKAIKCFLPPEENVKVRYINECRKHLDQEIEAFKPKYMLVLGDSALKMTYGRTGITKYRGTTYEYKGVKCIATFAPGAVLRQPRYFNPFYADINFFARMISGKKVSLDDFKWELVTTEKGLQDMIKEVLEEKVISYDIETTTLKDMDTGKILMIGIGTSKKCWVIPWELNDPILPIDSVKDILNKILKDADIIRVAHNGKFDNRWLRSRGIKPYLNFDTFLASYCLNVTTPHDLKYLAKVYFGADDYAIDTKALEGLPLEEVAKYCALDVYYTRKLYFSLKKELLADQGIARSFIHIVMPGARVLEDIEEKGAYVDINKVKSLKTEYNEKIKELEKEMNKYASDIKDINWNSTKQLAEILFDRLKLTPIDGRSTAKSVLLRLVDKHPLPQMILEHRKMSKAVSAFLEPWEKILQHEIDMGREPRIHTTYNIAKTATGRLSSEKPNLQQVPRLKEIRSLISAPKGKKIIEADFSQIELRVAAFIAGEPTMKSIYRKGGDIHANTAAEVAGVKLEEVTKEMRTGAKAVNFGYLYGMWWKSFKSYAFDTYGIVISDEEAQLSRERYFKKYSKLLQWHERQKREVRNYKAVRNPLGRIRHLPNIDSPDRDLRSEAERQAINTPVQSMASDMTILAMILINKKLKELNKKVNKEAVIIGQVHDAILVECDEEIAFTVAKVMKKIMENLPLKHLFGVNFDIPIVADVKIGDSWGSGEELDFSKGEAT